MKRIVLLLSLLAAFSFVSPAQPSQIGGQQWKLVGLNGASVSVSNPYLEFDLDQKRMSGHAGCNRMFSGVDIRGRQLIFSNIGTTRMACSDARVQSIETAFVSALKSIDRFKQSGNTLELLDQQRVVLKFAAYQKPAATRLEDKKWVLESLGSAPVGKEGRTAFLVFDKAKASVGGDSSCNAFGGGYSTTGAMLKITDVISTMRACVEDDRMNIERQFLDGLQETNRFKIRNDKLMLYRDDSLLLTLTGKSK